MSSMSYSPYGVMKRVGELYTRSLNGLIVKFWNVYGIEKDHDKAHVITDFIRKGFETGVIDMMTDGTEQREFLYAEDCCEALERLMLEYDQFTSDSELHITLFCYYNYTGNCEKSYKAYSKPMARLSGLRKQKRRMRCRKMLVMKQTHLLESGGKQRHL